MTDGAGEQREPEFTLEPNPEMQAEQVPDERPPTSEPEGDPPDEVDHDDQVDQAPATQADGSPVRRSNRTRRTVTGNRLVDALAMAVMCATVGDVNAVEKPALTAPAPGEVYAFSTLLGY